MQKEDSAKYIETDNASVQDMDKQVLQSDNGQQVSIVSETKGNKVDGQDNSSGKSKETGNEQNEQKQSSTVKGKSLAPESTQIKETKVAEKEKKVSFAEPATETKEVHKIEIHNLRYHNCTNTKSHGLFLLMLTLGMMQKLQSLRSQTVRIMTFHVLR